MSSLFPGSEPWRYSPEDLWGAVYGADNSLIATVFPGILNRERVTQAARVIACAPDMLRLLRDMAELFETQNDADEEAWDKIFERCRDVLKKAEGET